MVIRDEMLLADLWRDDDGELHLSTKDADGSPRFELAGPPRGWTHLGEVKLFPGELT